VVYSPALSFEGPVDQAGGLADVVRRNLSEPTPELAILNRDDHDFATLGAAVLTHHLVMNRSDAR